MTWKTTDEAKQRLKKEKGTVFKDWGGRIHIALVYPNSYYLGMSSLGFQTIYGFLNSYKNIVCERVFWEPKRRLLDEPVSLETQRPLSDFDVIAFSIYYELDYFHVVQIFKAGGIPIFAADRDESHPLVMAGGPCVTANPEPLSSIFDCFAIGEGEAVLPQFISILSERFQGKKGDLLQGLASLPGVYVPVYYNGIPVIRQWLKDLDSVTTSSVILTPDTELSDIRLVEIARGCGRGCRFCLAGFWSRPFRFRSVDKIITQAADSLKCDKKIGLLAAAVSDYPYIDELVWRLRQLGAILSVSSLRIRPLSGVLLSALARSGAQTVSLAPEAGSERLRQFINKCVTEDDIMNAVDMIVMQGLRHIKLYFMIGLPTESEDDIEELIKLTLVLKSRIEKSGCRLAVTVEPFVPKPGTPFQWLPMAPVEVLKHRMKRINNMLAKNGVEIRAESINWSLVQGLLSRGNFRLGAVLAHMKGNTFAAWRQALERFEIDTQPYLHRELLLDQPLPWSKVVSGVTSDYLVDELEEARRGVETTSCPLKNCHRCGVC